MKRKNSDIPTKIYRYGIPTSVRHDVTNREAIERELRSLSQYRNAVREVEVERRARYREAVQRYPDVAEYQQRIGLISQEIDQLVEEAKAERKAQRKRVKDPERTVRIKELKLQRKELVAKVKETKAQLADAPEVLAVEQYAREAWKAMYNAEFAPRAWGTRLRADEHLHQSFTQSKEDPRFRRYDGTGEIAVQIQSSNKDGVTRGGLTTEGLLACKDTRARLEHCKGRYYRLHLRVDSEGRAPVWASWPVVLHRPLPPGANIKWVVAQRIRAPHRGTLGHPDCGFTWQVLFIIESTSFIVPLRTSGHVGAINFGFRKLDEAGSLRVGYVVGTDGTRREITLESYGPRERHSGRYQYPSGRERRHRPSVRVGLQFADKKRSQRDTEFNAIRKKLMAARDTAPEWLQQATETLPHWRNPAKLHRVRVRWAGERYDGDGEIFAAVDSWARADRHNMQHEVGCRERAYAARTAMYRSIARELCLQFREIRIPKSALAKLRIKRRADQEGESELETSQRRQLNDAAAYSFIQALRLMAQNTGAVIVECDPAYISSVHFTCGEKCNADMRPSIEVQCEHCGHTFDQDENAALNLLASGGVGHDHTGPLAVE